MALSRTRWSWIDKAREGDEAATRALFDKYRPAVVAWLERHGAGAEAEDLAQEVFLELFQGVLSKANPEQGRFRSLLFAVSRNRLGTHLRRQGAAKRGGGQAPAPLEHDVAAPAAEDDSFDHEWTLNLIELALSRLEQEHPQYFEALKRCTLDGQPQAELAEALSCSVQTIKNRIHRGRAKLNGYLREEVWSYSNSPDEYSAELELLTRFLPE